MLNLTKEGKGLTMAKGEYISITQLAKMLNITYQGAKKKLASNEERLKKYLVYDGSKIKGIYEAGLEELKKTPYRVSTASRLNAELVRQESINAKSEELYSQLIAAKDENLKDLREQLERSQAENVNLKNELQYYRTAGVFQRLIGYKGKN